MKIINPIFIILSITLFFTCNNIKHITDENTNENMSDTVLLIDILITNKSIKFDTIEELENWKWKIKNDLKLSIDYKYDENINLDIDVDPDTLDLYKHTDLLVPHYLLCFNNQTFNIDSIYLSSLGIIEEYVGFRNLVGISYITLFKESTQTYLKIEWFNSLVYGNMTNQSAMFFNITDSKNIKMIRNINGELHSTKTVAYFDNDMYIDYLFFEENNDTIKFFSFKDSKINKEIYLISTRIFGEGYLDINEIEIIESKSKLSINRN